MFAVPATSNMLGNLQKHPIRSNPLNRSIHNKPFHLTRATPRHEGTSSSSLSTGLAGALLAASLLIAPVQQASAAPSVGCAKCDESNAASLLVELQEQELPALQANVSKIRDPKIGSAVESKLSSIETEVAMLAESYDQGKMPAAGLARSANHVISEIASLKSEMRANE